MPTKGPTSRYRPKRTPGKSLSLTDLGWRILAAAAQRTSASESDIAEHLLRKHGGEITADELADIPNNGEAA